MRIQILVGFSVSADYRAFLSTARAPKTDCGESCQKSPRTGP